MRVPSVAAHGARLDWPQLCLYGTQSAAHYRAYLSAIAWLDRSARGGQPITRLIGQPLKDEAGNPIQGKGGRVLRSDTDFVPNPSARFVGTLTDHDLTRMLGYDPTIRQRRCDARRAFEQLKQDGILEIEEAGRGKYRIFGPKLTKPQKDKTENAAADEK